jgi:alpha-L-fucosidase
MTGYGPVDILWLDAGQVRPPQQDIHMDRLAAMARQHQPRLIHLLVDIVGKGGNFLLNVGPQPDGELPAAALQRMKEIGDWMEVNGEAIYGTRPVAPYKQGQTVFTRQGGTVYVIYLTNKEGEGLPEKLDISALKPAPASRVQLLGAKEPMVWRIAPDGRTTIQIPASVVQAPPCQHAFVFKFEQAL